MAGSNQRFTIAAFALPLLFLAMSGMARATNIIVNTTDGGSDSFPLCTLPDAVTAHNMQMATNGCAAGTGHDTILFGVTGKIFIQDSLEIMNGTLTIQGPIFGCSGLGPCGITIDGGGHVQIIRADSGTTVFLTTLTFNHGFAITSPIIPDTGGGAVYADGSDLEINDCLFVNNKAKGAALPTAQVSGPIVPTVGGSGGAIYANSGNVVITNSTFANNTAVSSTLPISPFVLISESEGGAIYDTDAKMYITNCTIADNTAQEGGGFAQEVSSPLPGIKGTIFQSNTVGNCSGLAAGDIGYNISSDDSCPFPLITSSTMTDSLLKPLANNGGPTDTFALDPMSPALGRIPVANCTDQQAMPQPLGTDQRLFGRPDPYYPPGCDSGAYELGAQPPYVLNSDRVQIARKPTTTNSDQVNMGLTFTANGDDSCDLGPQGDEDALNFGVGVALVEGTCANLPNSGLFVNLFPFVVHTVNKQQYGTLFQTIGPEQISARMVAFPPQPGVCGEWTLNLEVSGLNTPALGLGGSDPFAILITDFVDAEGCFDINNAIVGNQIPIPGHGVRRGVHRR